MPSRSGAAANTNEGPRPEDMKAAAMLVIDADESGCCDDAAPVDAGEILLQESVVSECDEDSSSSSSEEEEVADNGSYREVYPGAEWVGGRDEDSIVTVESETAQVEDLNGAQNEIEAIDSTIVDPEAQERRIKEKMEEEKRSAPLAELVKEAPWWRRQSTICIACVLLLVIIIVAVTVPITRQNASGGEDIAMFSPTASPTPTALALITFVIQLDGKPYETGWTLECDGRIVQDVPPGTYGLLDGRPNFRIEYPVVVTAGADCQLTLLDTGGDGLEPGFYAIYNGQGVGTQEDLILGGNFIGGETIASFTLGSTAPLSPMAAPTAGDTATPALCTVCPDGTPVAFPDADAEGWGMTCQELEFLAAITTNAAICRNMQDQAAFGCGCRNFCTTMCPDRVSDINPANANDTVFILFNQPVICSELQTDIESARSNSQDQCLSANFLGEDVCGCPQTGPFCRICEGTGGNPSTNPSEEALLTEIVPGVNCLDVTGIAYTLKTNDPRTGFNQLCPATLSVGAYCGCDVPSDGREFCRLCGGPQDILPEPSRLVYSSILGYRTTCYHAEFISNINDNSTLPCDEYRDDTAEVCCTLYS